MWDMLLVEISFAVLEPSLHSPPLHSTFRQLLREISHSLTHSLSPPLFQIAA